MKTGIIIANTGSPSSTDPDAIEAYLREFLLDDRICQMPKPIWKYIVYRHILPKRKFASAKRYEFIWQPEGSPLIFTQQKLAGKLQASFDATQKEGDETEYIVRSAMSYGEPSMNSVLAELRDLHCDNVILLPLYPQKAFSNTLSVVDAYKRARKDVGWRPATCVIEDYHDNPLYIQAIVDQIRESGFDPNGSDHLMLSFHAIPLKDEANGDDYRKQINQTVALIAQNLGMSAAKVAVSFQSVFGHKEDIWVSPLSIHLLPEWRDKDFRVFFGCPGFAIDCLETLFDVPNELCPALEGEQKTPLTTCAQTGGDIQAACNTEGRFKWVPCLNASDRHVAVIRDVLDKAIAAGKFDL